VFEPVPKVLENVQHCLMLFAAEALHCTLWMPSMPSGVYHCVETHQVPDPFIRKHGEVVRKVPQPQVAEERSQGWDAEPAILGLACDSLCPGCCVHKAAPYGVVWG